jgi:two-component system response regulator MprA
VSAPAPGWILIVDDDPDFREIASRILRQAGFATREAATGEEALEIAGRDRPDLVVLDVRLGGGLSGHEVCRMLKEEIFPEPAVIFVSGALVEPFDRADGLLVGADDYVVKPFAADEFLARIRALIRRSGNNIGAAHLTEVEREIAGFLKEGVSEPEIAQRLAITPATARTHIEHIFEKLGV